MAAFSAFDEQFAPLIDQPVMHRAAAIEFFFKCNSIEIETDRLCVKGEQITFESKIFIQKLLLTKGETYKV